MNYGLRRMGLGGSRFIYAGPVMVVNASVEVWTLWLDRMSPFQKKLVARGQTAFGV